MRYTSCHDEMCQLTYDVENIIYVKMIESKCSNTDPKSFLWYLWREAACPVFNVPAQEDSIC